ncbi:MAG: thermonuclease family protein [Deltaproteobacteria bacterium]|nr:thermonuclease family protein [Deltaproteobacteria bacterium]
MLKQLLKSAALTVILAAALAAALPAPAARAESALGARVARVMDGDTLEVDAGWALKVKVRLAGVDCPESAGRKWAEQPYAAEAKAYTKAEAEGKDVRILVTDMDMYRRLVGRVILPDGRDLGAELVRRGLAWAAPQYFKFPLYVDLQTLARQERRGLWAGDEPVEPHTWRHRK